MNPSEQSKRNLNDADRAIVARLRGSETRPDRWYVMLTNADNSRAAGVCDADGFVLLFGTSRAAREWIAEQRPDSSLISFPDVQDCSEESTNERSG